MLKIGLPLLAFLPALPVALNVSGVIQDSAVVKVANIFYLPVYSSAALAETFGNNLVTVLTAIIGWFAWTIFIAWALKQAADVVASPQFDWLSFRDGFVVGGVVGILFGWYAWVRIFWKTLNLSTCVILGAIFTGVALGISFGSKWFKYR